MYVTVLSCTTGLLLVLTLYVGVAADCFAISDFLRNGLNLYSESVLKLVLYNIQLLFALSTKECLACLSISFDYEGRIFFSQSCKT